VCEYQQCPSEVNDCFGSSACTTFMKCYRDCAGDPMCQNGCGNTNLEGLQLAQKVGECGKALCTDSCP
jgi:hypothetical protein